MSECYYGLGKYKVELGVYYMKNVYCKRFVVFGVCYFWGIDELLFFVSKKSLYKVVRIEFFL